MPALCPDHALSRQAVAPRPSRSTWWTGIFVVPKADLERLVEIQPGEIFNRKLITATQKLIQDRLGEDGYARLLPKSREGERLTWNKYKAQILDELIKRQSADGSWTSGYIGQVYSTACFLAMLQLEKGTLPLYQK